MKEGLKTDGPWTMFWDMHSGGSTKVEPYEKILIRGTEDQAVKIFSEIFERDPRHVTCRCCGEDYAISEASDLYQVTGFSRNCAWNEEAKKYEEVQGRKFSMGDYITLEDYLQKYAVYLENGIIGIKSV